MNRDEINEIRMAALLKRIAAHSAAVTAWTSGVAVILAIFAVVTVLMNALGRWLA